jgi:LysM repeat protein
MVATKVVRYLAPTGLVAVIVATVLVISSGLSSSTTAHRSPPAHHSRPNVAAAHAAPRKGFYVVQSGDSLSTISVKTGVSVSALRSLNQSIDPNALQIGQRLRLRQ